MHEEASRSRTLAQHLAAATERLASVTETPRLDAEILLAHALGISRTQLLAHLHSFVSEFVEASPRKNHVHSQIQENPPWKGGRGDVGLRSMAGRGESSTPPLPPLKGGPYEQTPTDVRRDRPNAFRFGELVERRLAYEPLAYILGEWEFFSFTLKTPPPLLVPRPETEHLVECVLEHVCDRAEKVLDLCTGTGCVAVAVAANAPRVYVTATDINPFALEITRENANRHGVGGRVEVRLGDLFDALLAEDGPFEVICSNPPYVEEEAWPTLSPVIRLHEDRRALLAGKDGLAAIRPIIERAPRHLCAGGLLALEIGQGQREAVEALLVKNGYAGIEFRRDLAGMERVVTARHA